MSIEQNESQRLKQSPGPQPIVWLFWTLLVLGPVVFATGFTMYDSVKAAVFGTLGGLSMVGLAFALFRGSNPVEIRADLRCLSLYH